MEEHGEPIKTPMEMNGDELYSYLMSRDNEAFLELMQDVALGFYVVEVCKTFNYIALHERYGFLVDRMEFDRQYLPKTRQLRIEYMSGHVLYRDATAQEQLEFDPNLRAAAKSMYNTNGNTNGSRKYSSRPSSPSNKKAIANTDIASALARA